MTPPPCVEPSRRSTVSLFLTLLVGMLVKLMAALCQWKQALEPGYNHHRLTPSLLFHHVLSACRSGKSQGLIVFPLLLHTTISADTFWIFCSRLCIYKCICVTIYYVRMCKSLEKGSGMTPHQKMGNSWCEVVFFWGIKPNPKFLYVCLAGAYKEKDWGEEQSVGVGVRCKPFSSLLQAL